MPRSLRIEASSQSSLPRTSAALSSETGASEPSALVASIRSSCRRVRSMNASPSAYVAVAGFSPNVMTLAEGISTSLYEGFLTILFVLRIMPKPTASAKRIHPACATRRGRGRDICVQTSWQVRNFNHWYTSSNSAARCRTLLCDEKPLGLCKGDLSITLFFSMGCGVCEPLATTFSASGRCC
jgi:hypothetical protein